MRLRLVPIRVESGQLGPYRAKLLKWPIQAKIQKKKKKKKKKEVQNTPFELNNKPYFSSLHPNAKLQLSLTPSLVSHSLCALCLSVSTLHLLCGCETLSDSVTSFKLQLSHAFST